MLEELVRWAGRFFRLVHPDPGSHAASGQGKQPVFIYDLRIPSANHPYAGRALNLCLQAIKAAGVADHTWVLAKPDEIYRVRSTLPEAILAFGIGYTDKPPSPAALVAEGYRVVNSVYSLSNR